MVPIVAAAAAVAEAIVVVVVVVAAAAVVAVAVLAGCPRSSCCPCWTIRAFVTPQTPLAICSRGRPWLSYDDDVPNVIVVVVVVVVVDVGSKGPRGWGGCRRFR